LVNAAAAAAAVMFVLYKRLISSPNLKKKRRRIWESYRKDGFDCCIFYLFFLGFEYEPVMNFFMAN